MLADDIKRALEEPTTSVEVARRILGLSRNKAYESAAKGEFPTIRFGKSIRVPTLPLKKMLGLEAA
jgi:hypothetical protein